MMVVPFCQPAIVWIYLCIVFIDMANKFSLRLSHGGQCMLYVMLHFHLSALSPAADLQASSTSLHAAD